MCLKVGDIVKIKLSSGTLVGALKVVDDVCTTGGVYAHSIPQDALGSMFYKEVGKVKSIVLQTTNEAITDIVEHRLTYTEHPINKSWEDALNEYLNSKVNDPIVAVTLKSTQSHVILSEPIFRRVDLYGKVSIRLSFLRVLESVVR